jgi:YihY family inner membrane protein
MSWTEHPKLMPWRRRSRFVDLVFDIIEAYTRHRTGRNASLLAYMGILTVFPLLLCATTVLGLVLEGNDKLQEDIVDSALSQIPVVGAQIQDNQGQIDGNWWALVIGLAIALWGSMRAFLAMQTALDDIWEVETGRANFLMQRVKALIGIGVIGASQIGNVVLAALVGQAELPRSSQVLLTIGGLAINVVVIGSMYRWLTSADVTWRMLWPGTLFAAFVYTALQFVGTNLMAAKLKDSNEVYGVFGSLIALATWISLHAFVALLGAELNAALCRRRQAMPTARTTLAGSHA